MADGAAFQCWHRDEPWHKQWRAWRRGGITEHVDRQISAHDRDVQLAEPRRIADDLNLSDIVVDNREP